MIPANSYNKDRAIEILTRSFGTNKSTNWVIKQDKCKLLRICKLMTYAYEICTKHNGAFISDDKEGAILFDFPINSKYSFTQLIKDLGFIFNVISPERLFKVLKRENYIKKHHPNKNYIYLWFLGVSPECQGKGIGSKLLTELNRIADQRNLPVYLETSNPRNLALYKRFGFSIYYEWNSDFIDFPIWFMRRETNLL